MHHKEIKLKENNEFRYLINVVYWYPKTDPEKGLVLVPSITTQEFSTRKEALKEYKHIQSTKMIETKTLVGNVSFTIISLELVDKQALDEIIKQNQESSDENQDTESDESNNESEVEDNE